MTKSIGILFIIFVLIFSAFSCTKEKTFDKETMAKAYVDILILKESRHVKGDSLVAKQNTIFRKYGLTSKSYEEALKSFKFDKKTWKDFFKKVYARIDTLKKQKLLKIKKLSTQKKSDIKNK